MTADSSSRQEIESLIPHRRPMLLVDSILERSPQRLVAEKTFRATEFFFQGHYPGHPIVPGVILCEACMQAGALLLASLGAMDASGTPVATRIDQVKLRRMVLPGDVLRMEIDLVERVSTAYFLKAKASVGGREAVRFEFACTLVGGQSIPAQATE